MDNIKISNSFNIEFLTDDYKEAKKIYDKIENILNREQILFEMSQMDQEEI